MEEPEIVFFTTEQSTRVEALKAARSVLSEKAAGAFSSSTKAVDTLDLIAVASWIIDGKDPWRPKKPKKFKDVNDKEANSERKYPVAG